MKSPIALGLAVLMLGGCAGGERPPLATSDPTPETPAAAVADLLAIADRAARSAGRDEARLAAALAGLDGYGARPVAGESGDPVPVWRAALPAGRAVPVRGRVLGPAYRKGMLAPGEKVTLDQLFDGGRQARVAVATPDEDALAIAVLDGSGRPICPISIGRRGQCNWVPPFSARHQIVLSNRGTLPSAYYLVID